MRRLMLLLLALVIGLGAARLPAGADPAALWLLRDAALLAALAVGLGTWAALRSYRGGAATVRSWTGSGQALFGAGAITALAAAALHALALPYAWIGWGVGLLIMLAGAFRRGSVTRYAPPAFRWERNARGAIVRRPRDEAIAGDLPLILERKALLAGLALLILAGGALRVWLAWKMPALCSAGECEAVLALGERTPAPLLVEPLARALLLVTGDPLRSLRLAAALVSTLGLTGLALALGRWVTPAGLLVGAAAAAAGVPFLRPAADPWVEIGLWVALAGWGIAPGFGEGDPRPWAVAGAALGLAAISAPDLAAAWLAWLALILILLAAKRRWREAGVLAASAAAAGALLLAQSQGWRAALPAWPGIAAWGTQAADLLGDAAVIAPAWQSALVLLGLAAALRAGRPGAMLLAGALAVTIALPWLDPAPDAERALLALAGFIMLLAALGIDQLLRAAARAWGATRARPAPLMAAALALIVLLGAPAIRQEARGASAGGVTAEDDLALAAAGYITQMELDAGVPAATILLPDGLAAHPAVRLAAGAGMESGRVRTLNLRTELPLGDLAPGGAVFLLPADDRSAIEELQRVYPAGASELLPGAGQALLAAYTVDGAALAESQGLAQFVYAGSDAGSADEAIVSAGVGPLEFAWGDAPPLDGPFSVEWTGALIVREAGDHAFLVQMPAGAAFSLLLDGALVLDSSAGLYDHSLTLAAGVYHVQMRYRSGAQPGNLALMWRPPGQELLEPLPRAALHNPALPPAGLLGTYTAGAAWNGVLLSQHKDRIIQADATLPLPWGVVWQGQIAAPRSGDYLIGAVANGATLMDVAGQRIVTQAAGDETAGAESIGAPDEGLIYLTRGWHPMTIRFAATTPAPEFRLYWQPPGQSPGPLPAAMLLPVTGDRSMDGEPLPFAEAPDARFGGERFALATDTSYWLPQVRVPPQALPPLPFVKVAEVGACGAATDQFAAPHGLAVDSARGLLYVADTGNRRVVAYTLGESRLSSPQIVPLEGLEEPVDVAVLAQGDASPQSPTSPLVAPPVPATPAAILYVLDTLAPRLHRFDPATGESTMVPLGEGFYRPRGLAAGRYGVIVADTGGARVVFLGADGALLAEAGGRETPLGRGQPVDVVETGGKVWAITAEQGRLWHLETLGSVGAVQPTDTIDGPQMAAVAGGGVPPAVSETGAPADAPPWANGAFFVTDPARRQIVYASPSGEPLAALQAAEAFERPTGIAAYAEGDSIFLAVSDAAACRITLWQTNAGQLPAAFP